MNKNIYYLSINTASLAHYMSKAIILPTKFYKKRPKDFQDSIENSLILSKNKFINQSNCSIEIILNDEEKKYLTELASKDIYLYSYPIPISRINRIYFNDNIKKLKTIDNINRGTAFIPERLVKVIEINNIDVNIIDSNDFKYEIELESKIETYNKILGGLAFVRYTIDGEYSENYFSILAHFNSSLQNKINIRDNKYDGAFTHNGNFWSQLSPLIYKNILEKNVFYFAKQENIVIEKLNGIFKYENINIDTITYKLAILNIYGEKSSNRKKTNDLIFDYKNGKIPKDKQEGISLIYGINNGYSTFRNQYDKKIVKFEMNKDDYYTIESVFQYVVNNKKDNQKFEYIDKIFTLDANREISEVTQDKSKDIRLEELQKEFQKFKDIVNQRITQQDKKIEELEEEIKKIKSENLRIKSFNSDEEKEKINIEKDLEELLLKDLKKIASERNIKGRSKMNKATLYKVIKENEYYK
jgi:hypothetical protein